MRRSGFTLAELLITAVVMAILGTMLARMLVQDSRFVGQIEAMMTARQTARAAVTLMSTELRMASAEGFTIATPTKITFRMPVTWGMACQPAGGNRVGSLVPTDSNLVTSIGTNGWGWLNGAGTPQFTPGASTIVPGPRAECTADSIRLLPGGRYVLMVPENPIPISAVPSGTVFYTYADIEYEFRASVANPGRIGLWRFAEASGQNEELLSPFDSTTRFEFVTQANGAPSVTPPGLLSTLEAIELVIIGESVVIPRNSTDPEEFELRTRITFVN